MNQQYGLGSTTALSLAVALALSACGGGSQDGAGSATAATVTATATQLAQVDTLSAAPSFHLAPLELDEPAADAAAPAVHAEAVLSGMETLPTAQLQVETIRQVAYARRAVLRARRESEDSSASNEASPNAAQAAVVKVYTPAQIRAAYQLPAISTGTSAGRAALGAGQTIYLIDANHNPNAYADLVAFNSHFSLPSCTNVGIAASSTLPLAPAVASSGCTFSVVYAGSNGKMSATAPAYDASWATEIDLDVQSAHAVAPLARIVLIEATSSSITDLNSAIALANSMGSGIVSMSFGSAEGTWVNSYDSQFQARGMQYFASTGDNGAAVNWPAASAHVVAVGGTTLTYNGGVRSETAWSGTGGGTSLYVAKPSYQTTLPGSANRRRVADVSLDADPYTGQYVAFTPKGGVLGWFSAGGTSIAAPEWAALAAVANAQRLAKGYSMLTSFHGALYLNARATAQLASTSFLDVSSGSDGRCAACVSAAGYDTPTGLGTPNATALLTVLGGVTQ
jgi:subtilase family serine protease